MKRFVQRPGPSHCLSAVVSLIATASKCLSIYFPIIFLYENGHPTLYTNNVDNNICMLYANV